MSAIEPWISPLGLSILLLFLALCFVKNIKSLRFSIAIALGILLVFSLPYFSQGFVYKLEQRVPQYHLADLKRADLGIVLGGGVKIPIGYRKRAELASWGDRLAYTAELYHAGKLDKILISAGNTHASVDGLYESEISKNMLISWGVNADDILIESKSQSTFENAKYSAPIVLALKAESIYLISSSFHLPRAHALFCAYGIDTTPLPANHLARGNSYLTESTWHPLASGLHISTLAFKEYIAGVYYGLTGVYAFSKLWSPLKCDLSETQN